MEMDPKLDWLTYFRLEEEEEEEEEKAVVLTCKS